MSNNTRELYDGLHKQFYNSQRKMEFCYKYAQTDGQAKHITYFLNSTAPHEEMLGKDLCEFSVQELVDMFVANDWVFHAERINKRVFLEKYLNPQS